MEQHNNRREEIAANLTAVRQRIADACAHVGRDSSDVRLIAVTKTYPPDDVALLAELGVRDIGENRDQEAAAKHDACRDISGLTWHFIGQLQTNKARSVAKYADVVHSIDRVSLVNALGKAAEQEERTIDCLVQVRLDDKPGRGGAHPDDTAALADAIDGHSHLRMRGVMGVAPLDAPAAPAFERLAQVAFAVRKKYRADLAAAPSEGRQEISSDLWISAGMSADVEIAIKYGATHVRVGRGLLGERATRR